MFVHEMKYASNTLLQIMAFLDIKLASLLLVEIIIKGFIDLLSENKIIGCQF